MMPYQSSKPNVFRDGHEAVAELVSSRVRAAKGERYCVWVDCEGTVRWRARWDKRSKPLPDEDLIGTYDRHVRVEQIEDDLIARMREISGDRRSAA